MSDLSLIASRLPGAQGTLSAVAITGTVSDPPRNFAALDNGTILRGTVQGRDRDGLTAVKTDQGLLKIATNANLPAGSNVTLEVRAIGDRLQVIVLAVDQGGHAPDPATGAHATVAGSTSQASTAETSADGDAQAAIHQSAPATGGVMPSPAASIRQVAPQPTVIVAGTSLTAIVIQSVPRDLIQSSTTALQQADDKQLAAIPSSISDAAQSDVRVAFTADFRPTPPPPIGASLIPAIHDRIAALFAEPLADVEMVADAALSAVGGPTLSADMRERIIALFVGEPANEPGATASPLPGSNQAGPSQAGPNQAVPSQASQSANGAPPPTTAQNQSAPSPANISPGNISPGNVPSGTPPAGNSPAPIANQSVPAGSLSAASLAQPGLPVQSPIPTPGGASIVVPSPTPPQGGTPVQDGTPSNGVAVGNPLPAPPPLPLPATPPAMPAQPASANPGAAQIPGAVPQPPQSSQPPAAIAVSSSNPGNQAVSGNQLPPPLSASPPPPAGTVAPTTPPGIPVAGASIPGMSPSGMPTPGTAPSQPALTPISPEILAQLLAAAETGDLDGIAWQVPQTPLPAAIPSTVLLPPTSMPTSGSLGTNGLQAATIANLLVILEQGSTTSAPLSLSALNPMLQDPAVSPSPIAPVSASPLPVASTTPVDANASAQSNAKPASTTAATLAALAESAVADTQIDPKAEGVALTAIVTSSGKTALNAAALGSAPDGAAPGTATPSATPTGTVANSQTASGTTAGSGATTGGAALANASAEYLATANAATTLAEDATSLVDVSDKGQLSGPLPTGTELRLRVLDIQQQPAPNATLGSVQLNPAAAGKATLVGQILGHTPAGHPVIHTSVGDLVLQQQASLPVGAKITLVLEAIEMAGANNLMMPTTPPMTALNVAQGWPTLFDLLTTLQSGAAPTGLPGAPSTSLDVGTIARLLQPGSSLAAGMADAIDAFRNGDFDKLFGALSTALKASGSKQDPVRKLRDEFGQLSTLAQDRSQQDWRCAFLPLWDDSQLQQINLFYRRPRRGEAGKGKDDDATRFVVEVNFTRLGGCQLDGLIRKKNFDLMIRSHQELPLEAKRHIAGLFAEARQLGNYAGDVSFQTALRFPVSPLDDIAKDSPSITA